MKWRSEWKAISGRILGLLEAGRFVVDAAAAKAQDPHGAAKYISQHASEIFVEIIEYSIRNKSSLAPTVQAALDKFVVRREKQFRGDAVTAFDGMRIRIALLASIRAELDYHLEDLTVNTLRATNRAFIHLQRSINVDPSVGVLWKNAFDEGEVACERLGGVHLLMHGIWAFKISGERERTDLVMGHHIFDNREINSAAEALILTEWKKFRNHANLDRIIRSARAQAASYSSGVLGGIELRSHRFIIIVSSKVLKMPEDFVEADVIYRHINLAVCAETPSKAAIRLTSK